MSSRWFHVGSTAAVRDAMVKVLGQAPAPGPATAAAAGDAVVVEAFADLGGRTDVVGGNAFSACRAWKQLPGVAVYVVVRSDDPTGVQLARFVLADVVLRLDAAGNLLGQEQLAPHDRRKTASTIDALLARHGMALADLDESVILGHIREWEQAESFLQRLQDPETGLFDGAYAALKLDEEWKRAQRFHLPLSLVLLDIGDAAAALTGPDRRALLADVAAVFLNECRDIDVLGRFTATTFLFLLPGTPPGGAEALTRRLLEALRQRPFAVHLAPAAGAVSVPTTGVSDRKDFLVLAEACLERARRGLGVGGLVAAWE